MQSSCLKNRLDELFIQLGESRLECSSDERELDELFIQLGELDADCPSVNIKEELIEFVSKLNE